MAKLTKRTAPTVREFADRFDVEHTAVHLKASTAKEYRRNLNLFILPAIGYLRIVEVTRADIAKYHPTGRTVHTKPTAISRLSQRCLTWLSSGDCDRTAPTLGGISRNMRRKDASAIFRRQSFRPSVGCSAKWKQNGFNSPQRSPQFGCCSSPVAVSGKL